MSKPESQTVKAGGLDLFVATWGAGPPVLFVHGFPLSGEMWHHAAERLSDRWRCIVPDLRGHGRSPATESVTMADFADDLAAVLDALGEHRPAVVVGLSMGGIIAFEFFRRHPIRVRALGLCNTRANAEPPEGVARRQAVAAAVRKDGSRAVADSMITNVFATAAPPALRDHWHRIMASNPPMGVAAAALALGSRPDSFPTLPLIDCPTLVLAGSDDTITPPDGLRQIHDGIRGSRLVVLDGVGHVPPVEKPDEFVEVLRGFLDSLPGL